MKWLAKVLRAHRAVVTVAAVGALDVLNGVPLAHALARAVLEVLGVPAE